ncbi:MAG: hypothetical protein CFE44_05160 [Burkholderiales bacterium PBB4]|nr:MAG: hypothetical protein CFE44_05160 [Burkholderiales bacterium PBB4]
MRLLKSRFNVETHLVELNPAVAERAREAGCADFVTAGDFIQFETDLLFDCITFLDMLEHVEEPSKYLSKAANLLNTNGRVIASIPNVGHWSVVFDLLEGRWDYAPSGIHCITHLRFFTLNSIRKLFVGSGFVLDKIERVIVECPVNITKQNEALGALQIDAQSLDTYAYLIVARLG